jgi:hypothetical protein
MARKWQDVKDLAAKPLQGPLWLAPCPGHNWDDPVTECDWHELRVGNIMEMFCWREADSA